MATMAQITAMTMQITYMTNRGDTRKVSLKISDPEILTASDPMLDIKGGAIMLKYSNIERVNA